MSQLLLIDASIARALNEAARSGFALPAVAAASWGIYLLAVLALLPVVSERDWKRGVRMWATIAISALLASVVRSIIGFVAFRPRPFVALADITRLVEKSADSPAFPSGHATAAFAIALGLFLWNRRAGTIALILATIISVGRIAVGVHYPSDVIGGAVLGSVVSWIGWMMFVRKKS